MQCEAKVSEECPYAPMNKKIQNLVIKVSEHFSYGSVKSPMHYRAHTYIKVYLRHYGLIKHSRQTMLIKVLN